MKKVEIKPVNKKKLSKREIRQIRSSALQTWQLAEQIENDILQQHGQIPPAASDDLDFVREMLNEVSDSIAVPNPSDA